METREITQIRVYQLFLNSIFGRIEDKTLVAISYTENELMKWLESEKTESYVDEDSNGNKWHKVFKKGSPIELFNPPYDWETYITSEWINQDTFSLILTNMYGIQVIGI